MERTDEVNPKDKGLPWLLVVAGTQTYIGQCIDDDGTERTVVTLAPAYRVHELQVPVEVGPGRMGLQLQTIVKPPFLCMHHPAPVMVEPSVMVSLESLHPDDAARWRRMVDAAEREQQAARAEASGITLATAMPPRA